MLRALLGKVDNVREQMGYVSGDMEAPERIKRKCRVLSTGSSAKGGIMGLKTGPYKLPKPNCKEEGTEKGTDHPRTVGQLQKG